MAFFKKLFRRGKKESPETVSEEISKEEKKQSKLEEAAQTATTEAAKVSEGEEATSSTKVGQEPEKAKAEIQSEVQKPERPEEKSTEDIIGGKGYLEKALFIIKKIDEEIKSVDERLKEGEEVLKVIKNIENKHKEEVETLQKRINDYKTILDEKRKRLEEYKLRVDNFSTNFDNCVKGLIKSTCSYTEIQKEMQKYIKEGESIVSEYQKLGEKVSPKVEIAKKIQENPAIISILQKYAKRSNFDEEGKAIIELLYENLETLKYAVKIGREIGLTNYELMPIMAAAGLKTYKYGKGVDEELLREFGVSKRDLEDYIVNIGVRTNDPNVRNKILEEMTKPA